MYINAHIHTPHPFGVSSLFIALNYTHVGYAGWICYKYNDDYDEDEFVEYWWNNPHEE